MNGRDTSRGDGTGWLDSNAAPARFGGASTDFDFESDGKRTGTVRFVISGGTLGWQTVVMPVGVVKNGDGPTLTVIGGTHGDEVEGPVAALKLLHRLQPADIRGRLIVLPALNVQAVEAAQRTSPSDGLDLNRCFPGDPDGSIAQMTAHFVDQHILPVSDIVLDIHTGGRFLRFPGSLWLLECPDAGHLGRTIEAGRAFGAPYTIVSASLGGDMSESAARHGCIYLSTELSGAGSIDSDLLALTERGILRLLAHLGMAAGAEVAAPTRMMTVAGSDAVVLAPRNGLFEPLVRIEDRVEAGQHLGVIHAFDEPGGAGTPLPSPIAGMVYGLRWPAHVRRAERMAFIATDA